MNRILIIQGQGHVNLGLGDTVQLLQSYFNVSNHHKCSIDILTDQKFKAFYEQFDWINNIICLDKSIKLNTLFDMIRLKKYFSHKEYDFIYDIPGHFTYKPLYQLKHMILKHYSFRKKKYICVLNTLTKKENKQNRRNFSLADWNNAVFKKLGIEITNKSNELLLDIIDKNFTEHLQLKPYIFIQPFYSGSDSSKTRDWPYFCELTRKIKEDFPELNIVIAPGEKNIKSTKNLSASIVLDNKKTTSIPQLIRVIHDASYVITLDTSTAHIASNLQKKGKVICGKHSKTPNEIGIETDHLKAIYYPENELKEISSNEIYSIIRPEIANLI